MLNLALSLSFLVPSALAEDYSLKDNLPRGKVKADKYEVNPGVVGISGVVEVPLYSDFRSESPSANLAVDFPGVDYSVVMPLTFGSAGITLSEGTIGLAGGKIKEKSGGKVAVIPELRIGELVLTDVKVRVGADSLGLLAFTDLALAVLPSEGVVRFAPAADADTLLSAVGEASSYESVPTTQVKYMRTKRWIPADPVVVRGTVNGQEGPVFLGASSSVSKGYTDGDPLFVIGLDNYYITETSFTGVSVAAPMSAESNPVYLPEYLGASVPMSKLTGFDIALDPSTQRLAIKAVDSTSYVSTWEMELAKATADLDQAKEGEDPKLSGPHSALASMHMAHQDAEQAVKYAQLVVDEKPASCSSYTLLGSAQAAAGNHDTAQASFTKAGELYAEWADMDVEVRDELAEASVENPDLKDQIQTHSCFDAWGSAAMSALETGDFETVDALYTEHHDLDASLAQAAALAYLAQERYADANAALVQMRLLSNAESAETALTRAVVQHAQGNGAALKNYERAAIFGGMAEARAFAAAAVDLKAAEGPALLEPYAQVNGEMALAYAEALELAGLDASKAWDNAKAVYETEQVTAAGSADFWAGYGRALRSSGDLEGATAALKSGLEVNADGAELLLLAGDLAADSDDYKRAKQLYAKAAEASPTTATYAGLLSL